MADGTGAPSTPDIAAGIEDQPGPTPRVRRTGTGTGASHKAKSRPRKQANESTPESIAAWHGLLATAVATVNIFVLPDRLKATDDEIAAICAPASRILSRHGSLPEVSDDMQDGFMLIMALGGYATRVLSISLPGQTRQPPASPLRPESPAGGGVGSSTPHPAGSPGPVGGIRFAQPGEGTGVPPETFSQSPAEIMAALHESSWRDDGMEAGA